MTLSSYDIFANEGADPTQTEAAQESGNALLDAAHGICKGAVARPLGGLLQIADKVAGGLYDVDENRWDGKLVAAGKERPSSLWEQGGEVVGMLLPFALTRGGTKWAAGRLGAAVSGSRFASMAPTFSPTMVAALENGVTGFGLGFVMPQDHGSGFVMDRIKSGLVEGGTFFVLGGRAQMMANKYGLSTSSELSLTSRMLTGMKIGGRSGLEAGLFHAQANALADGKLYASPMNYVADGLGFAAFGTILGTAEPLWQARKSLSAVAPTEASRPPATEQVRIPSDSKPANDVAPKAAEPIPKTTEQQPAGQARSEGTTRPTETEPIKFDKRRRLGGESEGEVYSNGDGSVTKVFHDANTDVGAIKSMFDKLTSIGLKLPEISKVGKTAEGQPAIVMKQIGDGDNLQWQLMTREIPPAEMVALNQQYYRAADILETHGLRIDWNTKNMRWEDGNLWILDPSFMKNESMGEWIVGHYAGGIGPRR